MNKFKPTHTKYTLYKHIVLYICIYINTHIYNTIPFTNNEVAYQMHCPTRAKTCVHFSMRKITCNVKLQRRVRNQFGMAEASPFGGEL